MRDAVGLPASPRDIRPSHGASRIARRALVATAFNLLFEYAPRGINDLVSHPALPVSLFLLYFAYFLLVDEFVRARRAGALAVASLGFAFGALSALFLPGSMFQPKSPLGLNWGAFLFVNVVWWATLQGVLTMYGATRLIPRRTHEQGLKRWQLLGVLAWLLLVLLLFRSGVKTPNPIRPVAGLTVLLSGLAALWAALRLSRPELARAQAGYARPSRFLDGLLAATALVFVFCMLFLIHDPAQISIHRVNLTALRVVIVWTTALFLTIALWILLTRRSIPV